MDLFKIVIAADLKVTLAESVTSISRNGVVGYAARVTNLDRTAVTTWC